METLGMLEDLCINIGGSLFDTKFYMFNIVEEDHLQILLGISFLKIFRAMIDSCDKIITFSQEQEK